MTGFSEPSPKSAPICRSSRMQNRFFIGSAIILSREGGTMMDNRFYFP
jgi:hypothetical protein